MQRQAGRQLLLNEGRRRRQEGWAEQRRGNWQGSPSAIELFGDDKIVNDAEPGDGSDGSDGSDGTLP